MGAGALRLRPLSCPFVPTCVRPARGPARLSVCPSVRRSVGPSKVRPSSADCKSTSICPMATERSGNQPPLVGTGGTTFDYLQQLLGLIRDPKRANLVHHSPFYAGAFCMSVPFFAGEEGGCSEREPSKKKYITHCVLLSNASLKPHQSTLSPADVKTFGLGRDPLLQFSTRT